MYLLDGMKVPSYVSIGSFINSLKSSVQDIFLGINKEIFKRDSVDLNHTYIDGTKIEANANKYTWVWKKSCVKNRDKTFEKITDLINRINAEDLKLRVGFFGAEPWTWGIRRELEKKLHIKAIDIYGLTEMCGPGVGGECLFQNGTHVAEDMFYPEIINPETLEPVAPGEEGELVFTSLCKEAMPILRYRTRDLTHLIYEPCECGRTTVRLGKILGRSDDMLIIRGVNVFPSQIETVLTEFPVFTPQYFITVDRI